MILQPIVSHLIELYEGVPMEISQEQVTVYGKVSICTGDTLGQHQWGGFKEGVGVSFQKCRSCYCSFDDMQTKFDEEVFTLRNRALYDQECQHIESAPNINVRQDLMTIFGLNGRSGLWELPGFDVTTQLPQDVMHTLLEGTVQYKLRLILLHFMQSGSFTLKELNAAITSHNYGYTESPDKPGPLADAVFHGDERYKVEIQSCTSLGVFNVITFLYWPFG